MPARLTELTIAPVLRRRRRLPTSLVVGGTLVLALVAVAALAQWIAPYPFDQMHVSDRFMPPNLHYLAGTDEYGRDVFSRLLFGSQLSLALGVTATLNSMGIGVPLGLIAGYCRSVTDELELKGFAEPVPAWRVFSARDVESRFAATRAGSSAPLVGRQEEMGLLLRAWEGSCRGRGQVVLIQGEGTVS
jgi:hypothetical protein